MYYLVRLGHGMLAHPSGNQSPFKTLTYNPALFRDYSKTGLLLHAHWGEQREKFKANGSHYS